MKQAEPRVIHLAQTELDYGGLAEYLTSIGAPKWETDAHTGAETLIEVMGRMCYRSFAVGLNANVTKVREGSKPYLENIIRSGHGSVLEHATDSYVFFDVSRAVTHQLVRARAGASYSQESLHYVRVESIGAMFPDIFESHPRRDEIMALWTARIEDLEQTQLDLAELVDIDNQSFHDKKALSTAMRRLVPIGFATSLGMTCNHRAWRHVIEQRTNRFNDAEIRQVCAMVFDAQYERYPNLYFDATVEEVDGIKEVRFENHKV